MNAELVYDDVLITIWKIKIITPSNACLIESAVPINYEKSLSLENSGVNYYEVLTNASLRCFNFHSTKCDESPIKYIGIVIAAAPPIPKMIVNGVGSLACANITCEVMIHIIMSQCLTYAVIQQQNKVEY